MTILLQEKLLKLCITFAQLKETPRVRAGSKLKKGGGREGRQKNTELFFFSSFHSPVYRFLHAAAVQSEH